MIVFLTPKSKFKNVRKFQLQNSDVTIYSKQNIKIQNVW